MHDFRFITPKNIFVALFFFVLTTILTSVYSYNQENRTIQIHHCVPTDHVTQEFSSNGKSEVWSTTKVWYQCDDHGRWLDSYDTLNSIAGND